VLSSGLDLTSDSGSDSGSNSGSDSGLGSVSDSDSRSDLGSDSGFALAPTQALGSNSGPDRLRLGLCLWLQLGL
jgi:clumping factor A